MSAAVAKRVIVPVAVPAQIDPEALPMAVIDHVTLCLCHLIDMLRLVSAVVGEDYKQEGDKGYAHGDQTNDLIGENVLRALSMTYRELDSLTGYVFHRSEHPSAPSHYSWESELFDAQSMLWLLVHHSSLEGQLGNSFRLSRDCISNVISAVSDSLASLRHVVAEAPILAD